MHSPEYVIIVKNIAFGIKKNIKHDLYVNKTLKHGKKTIGL